jgi:hypothetical protein
MTRTGITILTLSVAVVLASPAMAKSAASISPPVQVCSGFDVSSEDYNPSLMAADLFKVGALLEVACFDALPPSDIEIGWISLVEILDNTAESGWAIETAVGGCEEEDLRFDFSELAVNGLFLLALHGLEVGCYETLPDSGCRLAFGQW